MRRVQVGGVLRKSMMFSNVIVDVSFPRRSLVFSQSYYELSSSLSETGSVAVGAIDLFFVKKQVKAGCNVCFSVVPCLSCLLVLHYVIVTFALAQHAQNAHPCK